MTSDSYDALISPDAYDYLDKTNPDDLLSDEYLQEQESIEDYIFETEEDNSAEEYSDDSDAYSSSLFDFEYDIVEENFQPDILENINSFCNDRYNDIYRYIRDCSQEDAVSLAKTICKARDAFFADGKDKLFTIPDTEISVAVVSDNSDPMLFTQRLEYVAAGMLLKGRAFWNLLILHFKKTGELKLAEFVPVSRASFSEGEWRIANNMAFKMRQQSK